MAINLRCLRKLSQPLVLILHLIIGFAGEKANTEVAIIAFISREKPSGGVETAEKVLIKLFLSFAASRIKMWMMLYDVIITFPYPCLSLALWWIDIINCTAKKTWEIILFCRSRRIDKHTAQLLAGLRLVSLLNPRLTACFLFHKINNFRSAKIIWKFMRILRRYMFVKGEARGD